jgi:hypothetical protein
VGFSAAGEADEKYHPEGDVEEEDEVVVYLQLRTD